MTAFYVNTPKAPRWISTEAGYWAWHEREEWRHSAEQAFSVGDRQQLLHEAEQLREHHSNQALVYAIDLSPAKPDHPA